MGKMHQTMVRNLLKRRVASGWMLETSTMYASGESSVAEGTHDTAKKQPDKLLFDHRQASDHWDLTKKGERIKALREVYGPAAAWMDLEAIADYWDDPQASEADFRRFWLNQPVPLAPLEVPGLIPEASWSALIDPLSKPVDPVSFGVYVNRLQTAAAIGVAGYREDGLYHVAVVPAVRDRPELVSLPGIDWIPTRVKELAGDWGPCAVVIDEKSEAAPLITPLRELGVEVVSTTATQMASACGSFYAALGIPAPGDAVVLGPDGRPGRLRHAGSVSLAKSVTSGRKRDLMDAWAWDRRDGGDITQLVAVTLALHGLIEFGRLPKVEVWGFFS